ncbi:hypothetical protein GXM_02507 [Nostoc sphaeroides CCNUC1]|uniref:Uncharacterized protein n=1 Tax=Nostoc sphaeroides CCNUC1 TaxID=2653204 RepID=A0A5P8VX94_9NOSO|nr:hypothetical protein GXM_02507 [Nostoc sphaeroides CCNUC1]
MQCLKRSKSKPDKGLVIAIAALVRNAGLVINAHAAERQLNTILFSGNLIGE